MFIEVDSISNAANLDSVFFENTFYKTNCMTLKCEVILSEKKLTDHNNKLLIYYRINNQNKVDTIKSVEVKRKINMP